MAIEWTWVHAIDARWWKPFSSDAPQATTLPGPTNLWAHHLPAQRLSASRRSEIREINIFGKKTRRKIHEKKTWNLDQDLGRNRRVNEIEISEILNHKKPKLKLKLTKIMIWNWNLKLYEGRLEWNWISNPRLRSNWSNYSLDKRLFIKKIQKNDRWFSRVDFLLFSQQNFTFKHSVDAKIDLEVIGSKRFKGFGV